MSREIIRAFLAEPGRLEELKGLLFEQAIRLLALETGVTMEEARVRVVDESIEHLKRELKLV